MPRSQPACIYLGVTDRCFLPCLHCEMYRHRGADLPTAGWERILANLAAWCRGASLHFVGGEPLLRRDLDRLIGEATALGFRTAICTNGWLITPRRARALADSGLGFAYVSLDGMRAETVDRTRGRAGSFQKALRSLELFAELPRPRGVISCILHAHNAGEMGELLEYAKARDFLIMAQVLGETLAAERHDPRWWEASPLWPHSEKEHEAVERAIDLLLREHRGGLLLNTREQLEGARCYYRDPTAPLALPCPAGESECAVDSHGKLRLCFYRQELGSALEDTDLTALWQSPAAAEHRRQIRFCDLSCRLNTSNLARIP